MGSPASCAHIALPAQGCHTGSSAGNACQKAHAGSGFAVVTWLSAARLCPGAGRELGMGSEAVSAERLLDSGH